MIRYLTVQDILVIHALLIDEVGGVHGVRDQNLLFSLVEKPKSTFSGKELYSDIFSKAAALAEAVVSFHTFVDGNKRTGLVVTARFLDVNGYELMASDEELEGVMLSLATKEIGVPEFAQWIEKHARVY